jgi:hypothetical protein
MKEVQQELSPEKPKRQLIVDVHGRISEPVCTYRGCDHKFSDHGFGGCRCKHPSNKALGVFNKYEEYIMKGQSEYRMCMKKPIEDEEYIKWMFMLGQYYRGKKD